MYTIKQLCEYTKGKIINGEANQQVTHYSVNHKFYMKDGFYVPIDFHGENREKYIIDSVKLGGMGFMINAGSENQEIIIEESKN